jgi:long-chain fatty acid transport protein
MKLRNALRTICVLVGLALAVTPSWATNGMYLAGYGSEAAGRAGANLAIADRALGLQANPAGIAQLQGQHLSVDLQVLMPHLAYGGDPFGNRIEGEDRAFAMPSVSYVRGAMGSPWTWGIGLISQGGMGATFQGYRTPFGTTDETFSEVRFATLTPTVAYAATPQLSFGLGANLGYSDVQFRFWPNTSYYNDAGTPADPSDDIGFLGVSMSERAQTFSASVRAGAMWAMHPRIQLGAIYQSQTDDTYDHGTLRLNTDVFGLPPVYYDATVSGFSWPDQFGAGIQLRPLDRWMVAVDAKRYLWSDAVEVIEVRGTNPTNPIVDLFGMSTLRLPFTFRWDDQWVWAVGSEVRVTDAFTLRGGYNFGSSPVPDQTLNPLFPATTEPHATMGLGITWAGNTIHVAVERAFETSQTNLNSDPNVNPFGPGVAIDHEQWTFSLGFSKAFSR